MTLPQRQRSPDARGVPAPASDAIDALVEAVSAGGRPSPTASSDELDPTTRSAITLRSRGRRWWIPSRAARWIAPALFAFAVGVGGAVWGLRTFDSFAPTDSVEVAPAPRAPAAPATRDDTPPVVPAPSDRLTSVGGRPFAPFSRGLRPSLTSRDLIAARDARDASALPDLAMPRDRQAAVGEARRSGSTADTPATSPADASTDTAADNAPIAVAEPVVTPSAVVPLETAAPVSPAIDERPAAAESAAVATTHAEAAAEETAVLDTVEEYGQALEQLDVAAAAVLWPSVDRRALSRAFGSLKSQEVMFENCDVALAQSVATARCQGTAEYVVKVGPSSPRTGRYEWLFKMRKRDDAWKIEALSAWPLASGGRDQQ
jgi:hypothetical protein